MMGNIQVADCASCSTDGDTALQNTREVGRKLLRPQGSALGYAASIPEIIPYNLRDKMLTLTLECRMDSLPWHENQ